MPFKSEAQRKYLWANEPEIARDWTDTYGSGIKAAHGGRIGFFKGAQAETREGKAMSPGTSATGGGRDTGWSPGVGGTQHIPTPKQPPIPSRDTWNIKRHHPSHGWYGGPTQNYIPGGDLNKLYRTMKNLTNQEDETPTYSEFDTIPVDKYKGLNIQRNYMGSDLTPTVKNIDVSQGDIDVLTNMGAAITSDTDPADVRDRVEMQSNVLNPTITNQEIRDVLGGKITKPTGKFVDAAQGGRIGYQMGNMVEGEIEGAEMEDAMMQSKEVMAELYEAFIAQGLSPQEAMEKIREIFMGVQAEGPEEGAEEWPRSDVEPAPPTPMPEFGGRPRARPQGPGGRRAFPRTQSPAPWPGGRELLSEQLGDWEFAEGVSEADKKDANQTILDLGIYGAGGRVPAAFGGIMDTYTGRRKYGLGDIVGSVFSPVKKVLKKVKKLASSKFGKLALMYMAGTYLGGTQAFGGTGYAGGAPWTKFGKQLINPLGDEGIANIGRKAMSYFKKPTPKVASYADDFVTHGVGYAAEPGKLTGGSGILSDAYHLAGMPSWEKNAQLAKLAQLSTGEASKSLIPGVSNKVLAGVAGPSIAAGLYTAAEPPETLGGEVQGEYDTDLAKWEKKLAPYTGAYRVPEEFVLPAAEGGRIGAIEGGLLKKSIPRRHSTGKDEDYDHDDSWATFPPTWIVPAYISAVLGANYRSKKALKGDPKSPRGMKRTKKQEGGIMDLGGMEKDYRNDGGFVPLGGEEKADDVPARLSKNEFVFTADAVRNAGGGDIDAGAEVMENVMKNLEGGGQISEESQGQGAQEMFEVSERLSEVI
jgi:hypothetical protein